MKINIETGYTIGALTVIRRAGQDEKNVIWECRCTCGRVVTRPASNLRPRGTNTGAKASCGCVGHGHAKHERNGGKRSKEYRAWDGMKQRCQNKNSKYYEYYGGRGIRVCERWQAFDSFLADMGPAPGPEFTLDRFPNNDGDYEPGNVRWATRLEQAHNKRPRRSPAEMAAMRIAGARA